MQSVSQLYAHVLKFMLRAVKWYTEGKIKHIFVAAFRPAKIGFGDVLREVEQCSLRIDQMAIDASQAEQRNIHVLLLEIRRTMMGKTSAFSEQPLELTACRTPSS
jgi:hypothetical protein